MCCNNPRIKLLYAVILSVKLHYSDTFISNSTSRSANDERLHTPDHNIHEMPLFNHHLQNRSEARESAAACGPSSRTGRRWGENRSDHREASHHREARHREASNYRKAWELRNWSGRRCREAEEREEREGCSVERFGAEHCLVIGRVVGVVLTMRNMSVGCRH